MKVIMLAGKAQHGKDTCAEYLKKIMEQDGKRVLIVHFADLLKFYCEKYFGWNGVKDENGRKLLQYIGTDIVRYRRQDFWANAVCDLLMIFREDFDYAIIPDTRFPNEIKALKQWFEVISFYIKRTDFVSPLFKEQQEHISENSIHQEHCDRVLVNPNNDLPFLKDNLYWTYLGTIK